MASSSKAFRVHTLTGTIPIPITEFQYIEMQITNANQPVHELRLY